ncbi:MAG TPA: hypothetical protein VE869_15470, partial [Gemmatimonas sp.]|nr:hypothetical protein [Gemmatimonas sp.]
MRTHSLPVVFAPVVTLLLGAVSATARAQPFEGVITVRTGAAARADQPTEIEYMAKGGNVRLNSVSPLGNVGVVAV